MELPDSFQQSTDAVIYVDCRLIKIHRLNGRTQSFRREIGCRGNFLRPVVVVFVYLHRQVSTTVDHPKICKIKTNLRVLESGAIKW
jgi:hypothetical protein